MAQHDQVIDNGPGRAVRLDIIAAFAALFSTNSGVLPPVVSVGGQLWFDTSDPLNPRIMFRNAANDAWLDIADDLVLKNPNLTGTVTAPTANPGDNDTSVATTAFVTNAVTTAINAIKGGVSAAYDTLAEIATAITGINSTLATKADEAITISAGVGLSGGGNLTANRTISHQDTSSQASVGNSNPNFIQDITLDGFGHVTAIGSSSVLTAIGAGSAGGVGTYALAVRTGGSSGYGFGATIAGSNLTTSNAGGSTAGGTVLSGTWRCMGLVISGSNEATLWLRIS